MNKLKRIIFLAIILIIPQGILNAKSINISVEEIFTSTIKFKEIKVLSYIGDSILVGLDINKNDTIRLDATHKRSMEDAIKSIKERRPDYSDWSGTYPSVGESIIVIDYKHNELSRTVFARKENENYRFWNPYYSFWANTVFFMNPSGIYKPTSACADSVEFNGRISCSDGFVVAENELRKILDKLK